MSPPEKQKTEESKDEEMAPAAAEEAAETVAPSNTSEPLKELEEDAKKDSSPKIKDKVSFLTPDTTMNVLPSTVGNMLVPLSEGGLSQLIAGARANVGVKSGRYMFEAKIIEQPWWSRENPAVVRIGFAAEGSLYLGEDDNSIGFDQDGFSIHNKKRTPGSGKFGRDVAIAVVLNLDDKSPNANTISLFKDGKRMCAPVSLPDELKGKALFPAVSFKGSTLGLNFGAPAVPLPFTCRTLQEASAKEVVVTKYTEPSDGKYTALFPVSLPDEGSFDWLDSFLEKNPDYTELSDRAFSEWGLKSGLKSKGRKESNDRPSVVDLHGMGEIKKLLMDVAALQPRNFVIMEVRGNLVKEERAATVAKFKNPVFKSVAECIISTPPDSFKKIVQAKTLKVKQDVIDRAHKVAYNQEVTTWKAKKQAKEKERAQNKARKESQKRALAAKAAREKAEKAKAKEEAKKKYEEEKKKAEEEGKEPPEELPEEEEEAEEEKPESEEEPQEADEPEPVETEPEKASLTAEEKALRFFRNQFTDLTQHALATGFTKFSLPDSEDGFDAVKYSWAKEKDAAAYVKNWILEKKQSTPMSEIVPSQSFKQNLAKWQSSLGQWKRKQEDYRASVAKKAAAKKAKADRKAAAEKKAKMEEERKAKEAEEKAKKEAEAAAKAAEEGKEEEKKEEEAKEEPVKEEEKAAAPMEVEEESEPEPEIDFEGLDIFGAEDILDIGNKVPLFKDFAFEDFTMLSLRVELHLLVHAFKKDCTDPDRPGIPVDHVVFYYKKYHGKDLSLGSFGVTTTAELLKLVNDTVGVNKQGQLTALVPDDLETYGVFAKVVESSRRHRHLMTAMGDESAKLKIRPEKPHQGGGGKWHDNDKMRGWQDNGGKGKDTPDWQRKSDWGDSKGKGDWSSSKGDSKGKGDWGPAKGDGKGKGDWGAPYWGGDKGKGKDKGADKGKDKGKGKW